MKLSIRRKLSIYVEIVITFTFVLLTLFNVYRMRTNLFYEKQLLIQAETNSAAEKVNTWIVRERGMMEGVANAIASLDQITESNCQLIIDQFYTTHTELANIYVGFPNGADVQGNKEIEVHDDFDPRKRNWYKRAVAEKGPVIINPYTDLFTGKTCCTIAAPVYKHGVLAAVVGADVTIDTVESLIQEICYSDSAYGLLLDASGGIVTHANPEFWPKDDEIINITSTIDGIDELITNPGEDTVLTKDYDGSEVFIATAVVEDCGWLIGKVESTLPIHKELRRLAAYMAAVSLVGLVICICVLQKKIKKLLMPINEVVPAMERIANGDFSTWLDFTDQDDEIGQLQNSMSEMVCILSDVISKEKYILGEIANGNLMVDDMDELPGDLNEISYSVNNIKVTLSEIISDIQYSAINLQSTAMGFTGTTDPEEMQAIFEELSAEANDMMNKANMFKTLNNE